VKYFTGIVKTISNSVTDGEHTVLLFATWNFLADGWRYKYEGKHHESACEIFHDIT
jgi:hypothetical protein